MPKQSPPSAELMRRLTVLWMKAQPMVQVFLAATIRNSHDAEDLLQDVAETVAEKFSEYDPQHPFQPWVMAIARNKVGNHLRKQARNRHVFDSDMLERLADAQEQVAPDYDERRQALRHCMDQLTGRNRQAIEMRYLREMSVDDIAKRMSMRNNAVFVLLHRIRAALAKCIKQRLDAGEAES